MKFKAKIIKDEATQNGLNETIKKATQSQLCKKHCVFGLRSLTSGSCLDDLLFRLQRRNPSLLMFDVEIECKKYRGKYEKN